MRIIHITHKHHYVIPGGAGSGESGRNGLISCCSRSGDITAIGGRETGCNQGLVAAAGHCPATVRVRGKGCSCIVANHPLAVCKNIMYILLM